MIAGRIPSNVVKPDVFINSGKFVPLRTPEFEIRIATEERAPESARGNTRAFLVFVFSWLMQR